MTQYDQGDWVAKSLVRRDVRDAARARFEGGVGLSPLTATQAISHAPQSQAGVVRELLAITAGGRLDAEHRAAIGLMAQALGAVQLGTGAMGGVANNIEDLAQFHTYALEFFFARPYKFEGPREA